MTKQPQRKQPFSKFKDWLLTHRWAYIAILLAVLTLIATGLTVLYGILKGWDFSLTPTGMLIIAISIMLIPTIVYNAIKWWRRNQ